jgi:hypothetical protein
MPYIIDLPRKSVSALVVASLALLFAIAAPRASAASTSCSTPGSAGTVFSPFGDLSNYVAVPGASFESSNLQKWTLTNEKEVTGNEPWHVNSLKDSQSLSITSSGQAVSPPICVDATRPWWRFFAISQNSSTASTLNVWAQWKDSTGAVVKTPVTTLSSSSYTSWAPTPQLVLGSDIGTGTAVNAQLYFTTTGKWQIDDVYVDPYAR